MKWMLCFLIPFAVSLAAQEKTYTVSGRIIDAETGEPLQGADALLADTVLGASSDPAGRYVVSGIPPGYYVLSFRFLGYRTIEKKISVVDSDLTIDQKLSPVVLTGKEVVITATRARTRETPAAFATMSRGDIESRYYAQDIPVLLSELPSTTFYSEGGSGIGYNYLSIRGFDQRRISVMINGIPQNDPEDHNIYWLDFPDLLQNVEDIQVQRGAGSAFYGPPSIGGSLNILTSSFSAEPGVSAYTGYGTFDTRKLSFSVNSGLLNDKYVLYGRVSQIKTDGYRDGSWVDFKSYFLGAARFSGKSSLRLQFYGGPIEDHLAYYGVSKQAAMDRETRRDNPIVREDEIENFNQPHLELIHQYQVNDNIFLNNTLFGIRGYGFFDYDGSWAPMSYFRLTPDFGFDVDDPENTYAESLLIRAYVDNKQIGWLPNLSMRFREAEIAVGGEFRLHRSLHWGRIQDAGSGMPVAVSGQYSGLNYIGERRYYEYEGAKDIFSPYFHLLFRVQENLNFSFALQYIHQRYQLHKEKFIGTDFDLTYDFFNPRIGFNYNFSQEMNVFVSYSHTSREPRLKNLYDAAEASTPESWGAIVPQFTQRPNGSFDFTNPLVNPEALDDFEVGFGYRKGSNSIDITVFYMDFKDEIIKQGQLDRFGQPITGNADRTLHTGLELSGNIGITPELRFSGNATWSKNELKSYTVYESGGTAVSLDDNPISGFPDFLSNLRLTYFRPKFEASISMQHVGKQYTDNSASEENSVDAYTLFNLSAAYKLDEILNTGNIILQLHIQNLLNSLYISHGEGSDFFPAATRQFFVNMKWEF